VPAAVARSYLARPGGRPGYSAQDDDGDGESGGGENKGEALAARADALLAPFADPYCNKHLLFAVLELVLVRLMPELAERGVRALLLERMGEGTAE